VQTSSFGKKVKEYRIRIGLTQEELAERTFYSLGGIRKIESGQRPPPGQLDVLEKFAGCLQVPMQERTDFFDLARRERFSLPAALANTTQLPAPHTILIGRDKDADTLCDLLRRKELRCLTLTGPGGVGKTQLAIHVASRMGDFFPDGVFFADLTSISDASLLAPTIMRTLGIRPGKGYAPLEQLKQKIRTKHLLLVLDNLEQIRGAPPVIAELLAVAPNLTVLVTSRTRLHLANECLFNVQPLPLPKPDQEHDIEALAQSPAVELFVERLLAVKPGFALTTQNAGDVAAICRHLDGLPIALELAAAWGRLLSPPMMLFRLQHSLSFLADPDGDWLAHHQSLAAMLDWSYALLNENEQQLFTRLAIFSGSASLHAAESICSLKADSTIEFLQLVRSLVEHSLLWSRELINDTIRIGMLDTIHEYALEHLQEQRDSSELFNRHAQYYLAIAENAPLQAREDIWESEHGNLLAAIEWTLRQRQWLRFITFYSVTRYTLPAHFPLIELARWLNLLRNEIEKDPTSLPTPWQAFVWECLGLLDRDQSDFPNAILCYQRALNLYEQVNDIRGVTMMLSQLGDVFGKQGDIAASQRACEKVLAQCRQVDDPASLANILTHLSIPFLWNGQPEQAIALADEAVHIARDCGDQRELAHTLSQYGWLSRYLGHTVQAKAYLTESLDLYQSLAETLTMAAVLGDLALVAYDEGNLSEAETILRKSLMIFREHDHISGILLDLDRLALISVKRDKLERAARLWGVIDTLREAHQIPRSPDQHTQYEDSIAIVNTQTQDKHLQTARREAQTLTLEQILAYALENED
jgi:predicted ATPase/DNA-binding XRE family transcriptional regulator